MKKKKEKKRKNFFLNFENKFKSFNKIKYFLKKMNFYDVKE